MASDRADSVRVLSRAIDQTGDVLGMVPADRLEAPTPCLGWNVGELIDHLLADPVRFRQMLRGEQPDWSARPERVRDGWTEVFRERGDDLLHTWHQLDGHEVRLHPDWMTAEFATHTWDLMTALGRDAGSLDPEVAERGLAFFLASLTEDNRGDAFAAEKEPPAGAAPYDRLAAFAGREVRRG